MGRLLGFLARMAPLMMAVMVVLIIAQLALRYRPDMAAIAAFFHAISWGLIAAAAVFGLVVALGLAHELRITDRWLGKGWAMDILDRLTNRAALEGMVSAKQTPIDIDAEALAARLRAKVVGQDAVIADLAAQIRRRLALVERRKPVGVFLFAGPPGTGKTYLAQQMAEALDRKLLHFDMAQLASGAHTGNQFFGAPAGYVGSDRYGKLTASLRDFPDSLVLLDEFEKAHGDIHKKFLTAWNDGFVTEASDGAAIATTRAIFVLTTNAATDTLAELAKRYADEPDRLREASVAALREHRFAPEVLNRIDRVFVFQPLVDLDIARVAALEIEAMVRGYGLAVADQGIEPEILLGLIERFQAVSGSSRDLIRAVEDTIADSLIDARQAGHTAVRIAVDADGARAIPAPDAATIAAEPRD